MPTPSAHCSLPHFLFNQVGQNTRDFLFMSLFCRDESYASFVCLIYYKASPLIPGELSDK